MHISYDPIADAMYIYFNKTKKSTHTESVKDDFMIDFNKNNPIGIEILGLSYKIPKKELGNVTFSIPTYKADKLLK